MLDRTALETQHAASVKVHLLDDGVGDTFGLASATCGVWNVRLILHYLIAVAAVVELKVMNPSSVGAELVTTIDKRSPRYASVIRSTSK